MQGISLTGGATAFRIRRPLITSNGFVSDTDRRVEAQFEELERLLGARVFAPAPVGGGGHGSGGSGAGASGTTTTTTTTTTTGAAAASAKKAPSSSSSSSSHGGSGLDVDAVLALSLTPMRSNGKWAERTLGSVLDAAAKHASDSDVTLTELVDRTPRLSTLRYAVEDAINDEWYALDDTRRRVLDEQHPGIRAYLVAYAYETLGLREVGAVKHFILNDPKGAAQIADYLVIGAARDLVHDRGYKITDYDGDGSAFVKALRAATIPLTSTSFEPGVQSVIDNTISDVDHLDLLQEAEVVTGPLPLATKKQLALYIAASPVAITKANIKFFAPLWLSQISPIGAVVPDTAVEAPGQSDDDFEIQVFQDDDSAIVVSRSAIKCAAQLYYSMVLGDELGVFAVVKHFTHKYLVGGGMEILDGRLRDDLQSYVFSERFTDLRTGRVLDRTRRPERSMFQRQVFDQGHGKVPQDLVVNDDFPRLWKTLMLESARYLERAQASFNPDGFVSRQNVMQAVEDLQYNLSTHCVGMATVATPLIHAELNFVIRRILMHPEVLQQVVPVGGTWWRVVEKLYVDMKHRRPKATVYYNKAKLGHDIVKAIADYNPSTFESDVEFSAFISTVDAYITTQSILQEALTDDLKRRQEEPPPAASGDDHPVPAYASPPPVPDAAAAPALTPVGAGPAANGNGKAGSDWDF
jgi:hypothetical protein